MGKAAYEAVHKARQEILAREVERMKHRRVTITVTHHQLASVLAAAEAASLTIATETVDAPKSSVEQRTANKELNELLEAIKAVQLAWTHAEEK